MGSIGTSVILVICAFLIDAFQFILGWAFFVLGMAAPAAGGTLIGAYYCPEGITVVTSACQLTVTGVGFLINIIPGVAEVGGAVGTAIGMALSVVVAWTLGPVLCTFLLLTGRFSARYMFPTFLGETLPMLNYIPSWTGATFASVLVYHRKTALAGEGAQKITGLMANVPGARPALAAARFMSRNPPPRTPQEGHDRAGDVRSQVLHDASQGIKAVRSAQSAPRVSRQADDNGPLDKRYGFAI